MANTGYDWSVWAASQDGEGDWTAQDLADNADDESTAIDMDILAVMEFSIAMVEDNTGAIDGNVIIFILGDTDDSQYEQLDGTGNPVSWEVTPVQNDTVYTRFTVQGNEYSKFKIGIKNESGQTIAFTIKQRTASIPLAS